MRRHSGVMVAVMATVALTTSAPAQSKWSPPPDARHTLWDDPVDLATRDTYLGPWGAAQAPDPKGVYAFVRPKTGGTNPGVVVMDADGREWHVKQPIGSMRGDEGPVEVTLSRVLSAVDTASRRSITCRLSPWLMPAAGALSPAAGSAWTTTT